MAWRDVGASAGNTTRRAVCHQKLLATPRKKKQKCYDRRLFGKTEGARVGAGNVFTGVFRTFFSCRVFCFLNF